MLKENRRILAVDDDEVILQAYRRLFSATSGENQQLSRLLDLSGEAAPETSSVERPPFAIDYFSQGLDAVAAVEQAVAEGAPYTVALIDMRMPPGIDGLETAQRIRARTGSTDPLYQCGGGQLCRHGGRWLDTQRL
jgi:CheY-like chemotaxis protein